jgi:hypothetical protein
MQAIKTRLATFAIAVADANDNPSKGHIAFPDWLFDGVTLISSPVMHRSCRWSATVAAPNAFLLRALQRIKR